MLGLASRPHPLPLADLASNRTGDGVEAMHDVHTLTAGAAATSSCVVCSLAVNALTTPTFNIRQTSPPVIPVMKLLATAIGVGVTNGGGAENQCWHSSYTYAYSCVLARTEYVPVPTVCECQAKR